MNGLEQICLWAVIGQNDPLLLERTMRVLRYSNSLESWAGKLLFTVMDPSHYAHVDGLKVIQIPSLTDRAGWEILLAKQLPYALKDYQYTLSIHDDGFPVNMEMWHPGFLEYDYIGAPWDCSGLVGSGGFSLTSKLFNWAMIQLPWYDGSINVDEWACRIHRQRMLELGVRFAPPEVAACFCTESTDNERPSFGYHGRGHAVEKHRLAWEKLEVWEISAGWLK